MRWEKKLKLNRGFAETAAVTMHTIIQIKCSAQHVFLKTKIRLWRLCGVAKNGIQVAKNVAVLKKL
jgi:hypothetical protein